MELVQQERFPDTVKFLTWISVFWVEHAGCGAQIFRCSQQVFFPPASAFHFLLRCQCGAMQFQIQFTLENRGFVRSRIDDIVSDAIEQFVRSAEIDARSAGKIMVPADTCDHFAGGTAAAIAVSVQQYGVARQVLVKEVALGILQFLHAYGRAVRVRRREVRKDSRSVDAFPFEGMVGEFRGVVP